MAEFVCRLGTASGEVITRLVEAQGAEDARSRFEQEGYRVFAISSKESGFPFSLTGSSTNAPRIKQGHFLLFNQQFSSLLRAGIPVLQSIELLKTRSQSSTLREVLAAVEEQIKNGIPLSEAFEVQGIFPRIYTASLLAGERSGALDEVLARYVTFLKRSVGVSRKLRAALAYPAFLLAAAFGMITFLTLYVVPRMTELFKSLNANAKLPTLTLIVLAVSNAVAANIWWFGPLFILSVALIIFWLRTATGRLFLDRLLLRIPLAGDLIKQMTTAQLARSIATLVAGGITVPDSWEIAAQAISNRELRGRSEAVLPLIREGQAFTESLAKANWLPELALDMIGIGEKSGSLKEMLEEVANFYDAETEVRLEQLTSLLEPLILIIMAAVVVTILLAIYLPIVQTISSGPFSGRR